MDRIIIPDYFAFTCGRSDAAGIRNVFSSKIIHNIRVIRILIFQNRIIINF